MLQARKSTEGVKNDPQRFYHLKYLCNRYIFKTYIKHQFFCGKTKQIKRPVFLPAVYPCI